jgi:hypothetical protein
VLIIPEQFRHLFKRDTFGLGKQKEGCDSTKSADDDEQTDCTLAGPNITEELKIGLQIEFPADVREGGGRGLKVYQVGDSNGGH